MTIISLLPALYAGLTRNPVSRTQLHLLQGNNLVSNSTEDCAYLFNAVQSWLYGSARIQTFYELIDDNGRDPHLLWAQLLPVRCVWQRNNGVITTCDTFRVSTTVDSICDYWDSIDDRVTTDPSKEYFADSLGTRPGGILDVSIKSVALTNFNNSETLSEFYVRAFYNEAHPIALA